MVERTATVSYMEGGTRWETRWRKNGENKKWYQLDEKLDDLLAI